MKKIMRMHKYLKYYNKNNISQRLLKSTKGNMFIAYNDFKKMYEVHSLQSFKKSRESLLASFETSELLNQWLIRDIKANDHKRFYNEIEGERYRLESLHDQHEEEQTENFIHGSMKNLEAYLGRSF